MKSTLLVSTATAAILAAFVVSPAQEMPRGGKADGAFQKQGTQSSQQQSEGTNNRPEQSKGKQAQPKPVPDQRQQTTGQRNQDQREQGKGKQAQPKPSPDRDQRQTTGQRDQEQQGKGKQAQPKPDRNRNQGQAQQDRDRNQRPQTTGQGQRDQEKAKRAQQKPGAQPDRDATSPDRAGRGDDRATTSAEGRIQLNVEQRTRIRQTVFARSNLPRVTNVNFRIAVGTAVPTHVRVVAVPPVIVEYYPRFRNHLYFVVQDEIIIVDNRRRIVAVIPVDTASPAGSGGAAVAIDLTPDEIRRVQLVLIERGYSLEADGVFGPRTRQAVITFQQKQGLQATGRIDSRTVAELGVSVRSSEQPSTTGQGGGSGQTDSGRPASAAQGGSSESQPEQRGGQANRGAPAESGTVGQGGSGSSGASRQNAPSNAKQPQKTPVQQNPSAGNGGAASGTSR